MLFRSQLVHQVVLTQGHLKQDLQTTVDLVRREGPDVLNECHIAAEDLEHAGNHFGSDVLQLHQFGACPPLQVAQDLSKITLATFYSKSQLTNCQRSAVALGEVGALRLRQRFCRVS